MSVGFLPELSGTYKKIVFEDCNISVEIPKKWSYDEVGILNPNLQYIARFYDNNNNSTFAGLIIYNITNSSIDSIEELEQRENEIVSQRGQIHESDIINLDDARAHKVIFDIFHISSLQKDPRIMHINFVFLDYRYELRIYSQDNATFDKNIKKFTHMIESLNIDRDSKKNDYNYCF